MTLLRLVCTGNLKSTSLQVHYLLASAHVRALETVLLGGGFFHSQESDQQATANTEGQGVVFFIVLECGHVACFTDWLPSNEFVQQLW